MVRTKMRIGTFEKRKSFYGNNTMEKDNKFMDNQWEIGREDIDENEKQDRRDW